PVPPIKTFEPPRPLSVSLPKPPFSTLELPRPVRTSSPAPPTNVPLAVISSFCDVPVQVATPPCEPSIITRSDAVPKFAPQLANVKLEKSAPEKLRTNRKTSMPDDPVKFVGKFVAERSLNVTVPLVWN